MVWRRKEPKDLRVLTEKEIQERLYGAYIQPRVDEKIAAEREVIERLEEEKKGESLKRKEAEEEIGKLRGELDRMKKELSRVNRQRASFEKELSEAQAAKEPKPPRRQRVSLRSPRTIFSLSPRVAVPLLVLLVILFASLRLIYMVSRPGQPGKGSLEEEKIVSPKPYTIQICVYEKKDDAERIVEHLKEKGYPAWLTTRTSPKGKLYYNIYLGRFATGEEASRFLTSIKAREEFKEFKDSFVRLH